MFPRHLIQLPPKHMSQLTAVRLAGDSGLASLISPLMRGLIANMTDGRVVIANHLGDAVVDLVNAAFAEQLSLPVPDSSPIEHRTLIAQVHRYIDEHMQDPGLTSSSIAAAHFVSLRHLQKVFEVEGESVSAVLRTRRLERCRRDLADPHLNHLAIALVGARWGFTDAAHFSRLFKGVYGCSPREYRQSQRV
jgi:AraC-like DNA-binding protein